MKCKCIQKHLKSTQVNVLRLIILIFLLLLQTLSQLGQLLGKGGNTNNTANQNSGNINITDPAILEQLLSALLGQQAGQATTPHQAFNRMRPMSRSMRHSVRVKNDNSKRSSWLTNQNQGK